MDIIDKTFDSSSIEERARRLWEESGIYRFDPRSGREIFSVDTPPPYVSAAHLHVGHAMSYTQAEIIVRYQRLRGREIFYPMGFDDNGLPTELFVEKTYGIDKKKSTRSKFRALCLEETAKGAAEYERLWRALGLSVDWRLRYSTIDEHCRRTAQLSFLDLYRRGRVYRSEEPVLWDPSLETALAQADLETLSRPAKLHQIAFASDRSPLIIATTRPELLPACVALYANPRDERHRASIGGYAEVPLFGRRVPILADEEVSLELGTGLMIVCTFGDAEDVRRWKRDRLPLLAILGPDGRLTAAAGKYSGLTAEQARAEILRDLGPAHRGFTMIDQHLAVSERSGAPVEWIVAPQWFIRLLDLKEDLRGRSDQLAWHPPWMKERLDRWIADLKYDWNISRQRFYGVPFPLWYCEECGAAITADQHTLPIDPLESAPPLEACPKCGGRSFRGEADVMDTWMTSSLTPLINANWAATEGRLGDLRLQPMTLRVQAFEIIRTWLFYSLAKSHLHLDSLPWREVMISGWGLNEQGKKIAKRDLEKYTDQHGYNRYEPYAVIQKYGADALRYWAAGSQLGHDARYGERELKEGRKLVLKLWNAARFVQMQFDPHAPRPPLAERTPEDRWLLGELDALIPDVTAAFDAYNYAAARQRIDRFFWSWCDDYLELVKDRFWSIDQYSDSERSSARWTLWESLRALLSLYAPIIPFVTEELYQRLFRSPEEPISIHIAGWPSASSTPAERVEELEVVLAILRAVRALRTQQRIPQTRPLATLRIDAGTAELQANIRALERSLLAAARARAIDYGPAEHPTSLEGLRIAIV